MARRKGTLEVADADTAAAESPRGYTVLARRYRSRDFGEIIGQEAISRTLRNAIESGRVAHAYLFCGTRGVGKTSTARIFACALNVTPDLEEADAINAAILRGDDMDVIEIDGASNRGVQEARDLIAGAGLSPARCRYRIYIIDEVHMLTRDAFNTLLKTMEEPPPHVKFILCTTEPNKVPATIQSRCQRFDFRAIAAPVIARHLKDVLSREGIEADDSVIRRVAAMGNGSMRDALSMLERLLAGGDRVITAAQAEDLLGLPDHDVVVRLLDAVAAEQPGDALQTAKELFDRGATVELAMEMLLEQLRALLLLLACGEAGLPEELGEAERAAAKRHAPHFDLAGVVHAIALCDAGARNARNSASARALFDATIVRLCLSRHVADIAGLLAASDQSAGSRGGRGSSGGPGGSGVPGGAGDGNEKKKPVDARGGVGSAAPRAVAPRPAVAASAPAARGAASAPVAAPAARPSSAPPPVSAQTRAAAAPAFAAAASASSASPGASAGGAPAELKPNEALSAEELWARVVQAAEASASDQSRVSNFSVRAFDGRTLRLSGSDRVRSRGFQESEASAISGIVSRVLGRNVAVEIEAAPNETAGPPAAERIGAAAGAAVADELSRTMPSVRRAVEIFQAVVTKVEDLPRSRSTDQHV